MAYYRDVRDKFLSAMDSNLESALAGIVDRVGHCERCEYASTCNAARSAAGHLSVVANIRQTQVRSLRDASVNTIDDLAVTELEEVSGIGVATFQSLREQARLQASERATGVNSWTFRDATGDDAAGRGFAGIPQPDAGDLFFDFEGYPYAEGGLEYLWGWATVSPEGVAQFEYLWADDAAAERAAFADFLDLVHARRAAHPGMHVYHYAPYEVTALKRLAKRHFDLKDSFDDLLRNGVFVDLFAVIRQAMFVSQPSYSIKYLEPLYERTRKDDEVASAGASIEEYERYLEAVETSNGDVASHIKQAILDYNEVDCVSTYELRNWLIERRDDAEASGVVWPPRPDSGPAEEPVEIVESDASAERRELRERLTAIGGDDSHEQIAAAESGSLTDTERVARLLRHLLGWVQRTRSQFWGELHSGSSASPESFIDDADALGRLDTDRGIHAAESARRNHCAAVRVSRPGIIALRRTESA